MDRRLVPRALLRRRSRRGVTNLSAEEIAGAPLKLVYTPLNGTGLIPVTTVLERAGITDVTVVPEQKEPNGDFPTCPYPNPEIRQAMQKGIDLCEQVHPDLLLATDPDADRVGVAVKNGDDYLLLTGNEMGVLLLDYICKTRADRGEDLQRRWRSLPSFLPPWSMLWPRSTALSCAVA